MQVRTASGEQLALDQQHFVASGGQAEIYAIGARAFKLFKAGIAVPPEQKFAELQCLTAAKSATFITPRSALFNDSGAICGNEMQFVTNAHPLCELFPSAFKARQGLASGALGGLVEALRQAVASARYPISRSARAECVD